MRRLTDAELIEKLEALFRIKGLLFLREAAERLKELTEPK